MYNFIICFQNTWCNKAQNFCDFSELAILVIEIALVCIVHIKIASYKLSVRA